MTFPELLQAIPSTEPASFNELMRAIGGHFDGEWAELFQQLDHAESLGLVEIDRGYNNRISAVQLTAAGADQVREFQRR